MLCILYTQIHSLLIHATRRVCIVAVLVEWIGRNRQNIRKSQTEHFCFDFAVQTFD